jgi:hypothetical protein
MTYFTIQTFRAERGEVQRYWIWSSLNWGNYDLVVIDESHNFRNGGEVYGEDRR